MVKCLKIQCFSRFLTRNKCWDQHNNHLSRQIIIHIKDIELEPTNQAIQAVPGKNLQFL